MLIDKTKACTQLNLMVPGPGSTGAVGRTSPEGCAAAVSATALLPSAGPVSARTGPPLPARSACLGQRSWSMACTICVPRSRLMVHVEVGLGLKSYHQTIFWCLSRAYKAPKANWQVHLTNYQACTDVCQQYSNQAQGRRVGPRPPGHSMVNRYCTLLPCVDDGTLTVIRVPTQTRSTSSMAGFSPTT